MSTRQQILDLVAEYYAEAFPVRPFIPGATPIPVHGSVLEVGDLLSLTDSVLDLWFTGGERTALFERRISQFLGLREAVFVNSGSSANLLAVSCLTSPKLRDRLTPGDEVITVAAGFPTTVNPIVQNGLVPVFVDIEIPSYNVDVLQLEEALSARTRAIILAHTLGNPFDVDAVRTFAIRNNLWLIEDCCDALGSTYNGQKVGTFGDLATLSFYPAHQITTGEGGCVATDSPALRSIVESFRDWGRDCWCKGGVANTCGKRYGWQAGTLPYGYDHKYTYSHIGYSLKATEMQAALGLSQILKLPEFVAARRRNFCSLSEGLRDLDDFFVLPEATAGSNPSWFGFPLTARKGVDRGLIVDKLHRAGIGNRMLFAGNLTKQPAYAGAEYRTIGTLKNTDAVMDNSFWIGVFPGITEDMIGYVVDIVRKICGSL